MLSIQDGDTRQTDLWGGGDICTVKQRPKRESQAISWGRLLAAGANTRLKRQARTV